MPDSPLGRSGGPTEAQRGELDVWSEETVLREVSREASEQDARYGKFGSSAKETLLALACIAEELEEAREEWRKWKKRPDWYSLRQEVVQIAAIAVRLARDLEVELVD